MTVTRAQQRFQFTGNYPVARQIFLWTDESRQEDPTVPDRNPRHVPVTIFYPAAAAGKPASYYPGLATLPEGPGAEALASEFGKSWNLLREGKIQIEISENTPAAAGHFPILVFSPGLGVPAFAYTLQLGELASHGFIVFALDHPYDTPCVQLPDGKVILGADRHVPNGPPTLAGFKVDAEREAVWVSDTLFALEHIRKLNSNPGAFEGRLDLSKLGLFGHSMGGRVAVKMCQLMPEVLACLNQDGGLFGVDFHTHEVLPLVLPDSSTTGALLQVSVAFLPPPSTIDAAVRNTFLTWQAKKDKLLDAFLSQNKPATYRAAIDRRDFTHASFPDIGVLDPDNPDHARFMDDLSLIQRIDIAFFEGTLKEKPDAWNALLKDKVPGLAIEKLH